MGGIHKALTCPGGGGSGSQKCPEDRGGSDSMCVLGVEGSEKNVPQRIISGTACRVDSEPAAYNLGSNQPPTTLGLLHIEIAYLFTAKTMTTLCSCT